MMKIFISVVFLAILGSFDAHAVRVRNCDVSEIEFIKQQFKSDSLNEGALSERQFKRGSLEMVEMCELRNHFVSDGLTFALYKLKSESSIYILVHNDIDGSFKLYGPFIDTYT